MATAAEFALPPVPVKPRLRRKYFALLSDNRIAFRLWRVGCLFVHSIVARIIYYTLRPCCCLHCLRRALTKLSRREIHAPILDRRPDGALYCFCVNKRAAKCDAILARGRVGREADALV